MTVRPGIETYAEINNVPLDTYGWRVVEGGYDELLNSPPVRGENLVMPGARGRRSYDPVADQATVSIPLFIEGRMDQDGDPASNPAAGMIDNRDYLITNLGLRSLVTCVFHIEDSPDWSGEVQPLGLYGWTTLNFRSGDAMVRLDLIIPDSELTVAGS